MMTVMDPDTVLLNEDDCSPQDTFSVGFKNIVITRRCRVYKYLRCRDYNFLTFSTNFGTLLSE